MSVFLKNGIIDRLKVLSKQFSSFAVCFEMGLNAALYCDKKTLIDWRKNWPSLLFGQTQCNSNDIQEIKLPWSVISKVLTLNTFQFKLEELVGVGV